MKRSWFAGTALVALWGGSAVAADLPVKAPPIVCPACNWDGWYVGGNVGGGLGHDGALDQIALNPPGIVGFVAPGVINPISSTSYTQVPAGFMAGVQAGYNWQVGKVVFGVEGDFDAVGQLDNLRVNNFLASTVIGAPSGYTMTDDHKIDWLATARARLGWATGNSLLYVTGGAAFGGVKSNYAFQAVNSPLYATAPAAASFGDSARTGWTVGGGVETSLAWAGINRWSLKLEYLYVDLGSVTNSFTVPVPAGVPNSAYTVSNTASIHDHILRLGLNYRFNDGVAPVPPTPGPCPTCSWQGFYVGANAGGSIGQNRTRDIDALIPPGGFASVTNPLTDVSHTMSPTGGVAGGQFGYNWQFGKLVVGAEGDFNWAGQRDSFSNLNFVASTNTVQPAQIALSTEQKLDWIATVRGRIGWTENCFLWYVTGGAAWGKVDSNTTFQVTQSNNLTVFATAPFAASTSTTKSGWTVGGGVETSLAWLGMSNGWSAKLEYLYVDLGTVANSFTVPATGLFNAVHNYTSSGNIRDNLIRVGINYRFDTPVTAKY